ncbi:2'-5' RNA ligase family protein [Paucibacter sp. XJ19-41]|uniref:2'-5' RNA ligase family protein n=1 Tax=Paucibacter sp. XJ19-41 TaxID=2927824 RepID=UPI00234A171A|nr:2'-5' RNA ligase family protein [Paucibacter sp. XJ19-41]MDC6170117.1 2'-5' RNA ligase family protein [Paucibacter sp. XJ19-41]
MAPDHRLFFALYPDTATALRIAALASRVRAELGLKGRPQDSHRFHITLHHLGDFVGLPQRERAAAEAAAATLRCAPFALHFDHLLSFERKNARNRPLVLGGGSGLDAVRQLRRQLGEVLARAGLARPGSFTPHLTLLYDDALVPQRPIEALGWRADELVLVNSLIGQHRHVPLARWPLRA